MKLTQIITIGIISLAISLSSCMQNKENKTTESSDKTKHEIAVKKTFLKGLTMADKEDFSKERVMLSDGNITVYDIEGNKAAGEEKMFWRLHRPRCRKPTLHGRHKQTAAKSHEKWKLYSRILCR